jgi:formate dehydrogenase subunit gamma
MGGTTADRRVTLEPVYCLGLCHSSPAALLDHDKVYGMLDEQKLDALLREAQA